MPLYLLKNGVCLITHIPHFTHRILCTTQYRSYTIFTLPLVDFPAIKIHPEFPIIEDNITVKIYLEGTLPNHWNTNKHHSSFTHTRTTFSHTDYHDSVFKEVVNTFNVLKSIGCNIVPMKTTALSVCTTCQHYAFI